jgi:hypothetical protein
MATVTTSTSNTAFAFPPHSNMERATDTGHLWMAIRTGSTTIGLFKSTDKGGSWGSQGTITRANLYDLGEIRIDQAGDHIHMAYLVNESSLDKLYYKRIDIRTGTANLSSGETLITSGPAAASRDYIYSAGLVAYKNPDSSLSVVIAAAFHSTAMSGVNFWGVSIKNDSVFTTIKNGKLVSPTTLYRLVGNDSGGLTVSLDVEHNGDGYSSITPNIWASFQIFTYLYTIKLTWQGYKTGWKSPPKATVVLSNRPNNRDVPGRWDGTRFVLISNNASDNTKLDLVERNAANTSNVAVRTTPTHTTGAVTAYMLGYNHITKDPRVFARGTSTGVLYYIDFIRDTASWGAWTIENATAPLTDEWGVRRSTYGTNAYDVYRESGGGSPWTITNDIVSVSYTPTAPTWITGTAGTVVTNGAAFDVSSSLLLDWDFHDPDPLDTQGSWALSRQIGAATIEYFRASDNTWQPGEIQNVSATTNRTLTTGQWVGGGGAADAAHVYKVKTWDAASIPSPYSIGLGVIPSTRVDPTLTAPTAAQVLNSGLVTATWTVSEQGLYRITLTNTTTSVAVHDSGFLVDPTPLTPTVLSYVVPVILPDGFAGTLTLQTKNAEGLSSVVRTVNFTVDFVEPVAPIMTVAGAAASGGINATLTQAAATGTQPATATRDVYRRRVLAGTTTIVNANPNFETNTTDWTNNGYSTMVRSTAQFHQGAASILGTPTGAAPTPYMETSGYTATAGQLWEQRGWVRSPNANKTIRLRLRFYDVSAAFISEVTRDFTAVANTWVWASNQGIAPAGTVTVRYAVGQIATPAAGDTLFGDELQLLAGNADEGIRIAADVQSGEVTLDWRAITGVPYEYRGYAQAANATIIYGPWQE